MNPLRNILSTLFVMSALALEFPAAAGLRLTEILVVNNAGLRDDDADSPSWIEVHNDGTTSTNLAGWHLTDRVAEPTKWTFPPTNLPAGGRMVVFASGKDRAVAGRPLHTNFKLDPDGEYLGLIAPDAVTVATEFAPQFPRQHGNTAFGSGTEINHHAFVGRGTAARFHVPSSNTPGPSWRDRLFDDAAWTAGPVGLGYETNSTAAQTNGTIVLALDVNERGTAPLTMAGFTSFVINSNGGSTAVQSLPTVRQLGGITVVLSNSPGQVQDDRVRNTPGNGGAFSESALLRDFVFSRDGSANGGLDLAINGLSPGQPYRATLWSFDSGSTGSRVSDWFANGVLVKENYVFNGAILPLSNEDYRFAFDTTGDATGRLLIQGRRDTASVDGAGSASFGVYLNALQLMQVGYRDAILTDVKSAMHNRNASLYIRLPFQVADPAGVEVLRLRLRFDDGFSAYINGVRIASRHAPGEPAWNSSATVARPGAGGWTPEEFVVANTNLLVAGQNILAIHGLNIDPADSDFIIEPELVGIGTNLVSGRYFSVPTPGTNNGTPYLDVVGDTRFSVDRGFYDTPFSLSITSVTADASIMVTLDGSEPSATNGVLFTAPLTITNTTVVRAAAFKPGWVPSDIDTQTYLFLEQVVRQPAALPGYPVQWQAAYQADYGMDPIVVNHPVYGASLSNDLRSLPTLSIVTPHDGLWGPLNGIYNNATSQGDLWERPASFELIDPRGTNGSTTFAVRGGLRMQGNASRDNVRTPKHSLRMIFRSEYGATKLHQDLFGGGVDQFDNLVLRACFTDSWATRYSPGDGSVAVGQRYRPEDATYLRDIWVKDTFADMGHLVSRGTHFHVYLNGLYWGVYNPCERQDSSFFADHLGGDKLEWDVIRDFSEVLDGDKVAWSQMMTLVNAGITTEPAYQQVRTLINVTNLIDYMMIHLYGEAEDWPHHNWYAARYKGTNSSIDRRWIFLPWDQEITLDQDYVRNRIDVNNDDTPARIYSQLRAWPEFRREFGDRVQMHLFGNGALAPSNNIARLQQRATSVHQAIVGESARWGDARETNTVGSPATGQTFTRNEWWIPELNKLYTNWFPRQHRVGVERFQAASLYPRTAPPSFNLDGGAVPGGFGVMLSHTNASGTIWYTTDGTDPRQYGTGVPSATAQAYAGPIVLAVPTLVRTRVLKGSEWSAIVAAQFYTDQDFTPLVLNEIHYNPPQLNSVDGENFEFLEFLNRGPVSLHLDGLSFSAGITFTFGPGVTLPPGGYLVLASSRSHFQTGFPGVVVRADFAGQLDNGGERLTLTTATESPVWSVRYNDKSPWPTNADGFGFSLQRANTRPDYTNAANWCAAPPTPGGPAPAGCIDTDADGLPDWWELAHGTDPSTADAGLDSDRDGASHHDEYQAGTDPQSADSALRISRVQSTAGDRLILGFQAVSNRTYELQFRDLVSGGSWALGAAIPHAATNRDLLITNQLPGVTNRFYRVGVTGQAK